MQRTKAQAAVLENVREAVFGLATAKCMDAALAAAHSGFAALAEDPEHSALLMRVALAHERLGVEHAVFAAKVRDGYFHANKGISTIT